MPLPDQLFAAPDAPACDLYLVTAQDADAFVQARGAGFENLANLQGWSGQLGQPCVQYDETGTPICAVIGLGSPQARARKRFGAVGQIAALPACNFRLVDVPRDVACEFTLGWVLALYAFDRYAPQSQPTARLTPPQMVDCSAIEHIARGESLTRDLINTPSSDMGPDELETAARDLARAFGADITVIHDQDLLDQNFPLIHAVGRASTRRPRLIDLHWGTTGPKLTLVGKGVCFDTGGLNIKPGNSMGLMKKDMGGAAHVLGLAHMIMASGADVQLRVLIPAAENAIGGNAFRPQDILQSRKGLSVEVNNTDAEGRLVLADALTLADEAASDAIICMATLTGAARVAVGPDIAPFFTDDSAMAQALVASAARVNDPVWQLPLHAPYDPMIEPGIADLDNAPAGGFAGAITAALFLRRFVTGTPKFMHFDCYGWQPTPATAMGVGAI